MVDTVTLTLERHQFQISETGYVRFSPSARGFFEPPFIPFGRHSAIIRAHCNPTAADKKGDWYFPRLTLQKAARPGGIVITLRVEFSAPKLMFLNNFDELEERDFDDLCHRLRMRLSFFGVQVPSVETLNQAAVSGIHYGKTSS